MSLVFEDLAVLLTLVLALSVLAAAFMYVMGRERECEGTLVHHFPFVWECIETDDIKKEEKSRST